MKRIISLAAICCLVISSVYATCTPVNATYLTSTSGGLAPMTTDNSTLWTWYASYSCGYGTAYNKGLAVGTKAHLFTPDFDFSEAESVTISFEHAHKFGGNANVQTDYTLWVTADYKGSFEASTWQQLTIPTYGTNSNWTYVTATIEVPKTCLGAKTVFAFQYNNGSPTGTWQVKNVTVLSSCSGGGIASPVALPELGDGRLKVFGQNLKNYYYNYNTGRGKYTPAQFAEKTRKLVNAMLMVNADVFAFCELEAQPIILKQLADSLNKRVEGTPFVAVEDDAVEEWDATYDNNLKSGFIYRSDKVKPYGENKATTNATYYKNTMRIQTFEELDTKARFTLSMNHFKAKDSSDDGGNEKRVQNANNLLTGLNKYALDPDILVFGDFNCEKGEDPITIIENAGYVEQLLKYDANAFAYCYQHSEPNLIDHVFANASMEEQITGAGVFHISTECGDDASANANYRYSDHDPYVVALNLSYKASGACEDLDETYLTSGLAPMISNGGVWYWNSNNYAKAAKSGGVTDYMLTPEMDLSGMQTVSLSFQHTHKFAGTPSEELTLWVSSDYQGTVAGSKWQQLTIPTYGTNNDWTFVKANIDVPASLFGKNTVFAFKYMSTATAYGTWEIKNLKIKATCKGTGTDIENTLAPQRAQKVIENGRLILVLPDGATYNVIGARIR